MVVFLSILRKIYSFLIDTLETILLVGAVFLVIYIFLFRPFEVKGDSMYPSFHDGEYVLTNLITLRLSDPKRGDVVVFKSPVEDDKDFIKRVIAASGDTVSVQDEQVLVNGEILDQSKYLSNAVETNPGSFLEEGEVVVVPEDQYFVMGDNRPYSSDSREWGFVAKGNLIGISFFVYWPLNKMGRIENPY